MTTTEAHEVSLGLLSDIEQAENIIAEHELVISSVYMCSRLGAAHIDWVCADMARLRKVVSLNREALSNAN